MNPDINHIDPGNADGDAPGVEDLRISIVEMAARVDKLTQEWNTNNAA